MKLTEREKQALRAIIEDYKGIEYEMCAEMLKQAGGESPIPDNYTDGTHNFYHLRVLEELLNRAE